MGVTIVSIRLEGIVEPASHSLTILLARVTRNTYCKSFDERMVDHRTIDHFDIADKFAINLNYLNTKVLHWSYNFTQLAMLKNEINKVVKQSLHERRSPATLTGNYQTQKLSSYRTR